MALYTGAEATKPKATKTTGVKAPAPVGVRAKNKVTGRSVPDAAVYEVVEATDGTKVKFSPEERKAAQLVDGPYAIEAIRLVLGNLQSAYHEPENAEARFNMHNASALAGMAFTNASLGLVHSLAHKIGGEFGVTHGLANAILLPYIIRFNRQFSDKYSQVEKLLGINDLPSAIEALNKELNIPCCFAQCDEVEFSESKFLEVLERMSQNAHADPCTWTNPGQPSVDDVRALYEAAFYGHVAACCEA